MADTIAALATPAAPGAIAILRLSGDDCLMIAEKVFKGKKGGQLGMGLLVGAMDIATANNTVAIVAAGPIARDIATEFDIDPRTSASLLDIFGSFAQGIIPYGAQLLAAGAFVYEGAKVVISPVEIMPFLFYPYLMAVSALVFIFFISHKIKNKKDKKHDDKQDVAA